MKPLSNLFHSLINLRHRVLSLTLCAVLFFLASPLSAVNASLLPQQSIPPAGEVENLSNLINLWLQPKSYPSEPSILEASQSPQIPQDQKFIFLTFDDGPDPVWTPQILAVLERYNVTATFYMIGKNVSSHPEIVLQIAEDGHSLANHSYNHLDLSLLNYPNFYLEVFDTETAIRESIKDHPEYENLITPCLRPPYGRTGETVYPFTKEMNYAVSMWNIDTRDWAGTQPDEILTETVKRLEPKKVILMHDGGRDRQVTVEALGLLLHELIMRDYYFLPYCTAEGQYDFSQD